MKNTSKALNSFEAKRQAKAQRYRELAQNARERSEEAYAESNRISQHIPFGQPILVGHHSEKSHRRDISRIDRQMRKSIEESEKAEYWENKAKGVENNHAISSDDPNAISKLKQKIQELKNQHALMKNINVVYRAFLKNPDALEQSDLSEKSKQTIRNFTPQYSFEKNPITSYVLANSSVNIRRYEQRLKKLVQKANDCTEVIYAQHGITIIDNVEKNRVQIFFEDKPSEEIRIELKKNCFRWSSRLEAWQRYRSNTARYLALESVKNNKS